VRLPIRVRMTAWYVALLALIIAAVGAFLVVRMHADLVAAMDARLDQGGDQVAVGYHAEGRSEARDVSATVLSGDAAASQVLTPTRRVVVSYGDRVATAPMLAPGELSRVLAGRRVRRTVTLGAGREHFRIVARATTRGIYPRVVVVGESLATVDRSVHRLLMLLLLACPAAVAATAVGGWWLARRSLRPIHRLIADAGRIGIDRLDERLPVPGTGDEVAQLAATLNTMIGRIEAGVDEQRRLVADASHELRTPLAAMRAELDVSLRADDLDPQAQDVLRSTREEVDRLSHTVDGLLTLARADQGALDLQVHPLDLAVVAGDTVERLRELARVSDVRLEARLEPAPARGDAAWLGQAVANLVDNAIKFSPAGTTVTVSTATEADEAIVRVLDAGPGIPTDAREHVFDRFRRVDASRTRATGGSGIGLSIVREIARAHGGRAWTEPGPGRGSLFVLAVPTAGDVPARLNGLAGRSAFTSSSQSAPPGPARPAGGDTSERHPGRAAALGGAAPRDGQDGVHAEGVPPDGHGSAGALGPT
jgi:heavy metal sensor kinase